MNPAWGVPIDGGFFDEERHVYRCIDGIVRPSSTQVFDILGMNDFSGIAPEVMEWKRNYGGAVHAASHYLMQGDLDWDSLDEAIIPAVTGVEQFLKKHRYEPEAAEERKIRTLCGMKFGTTLDTRGTILYHDVRRPAIVDLKTGSKRSPTWDWQLGSYSVEQEKKETAWIGLVIQTDIQGIVEPYWVIDLEKAKREFQHLLAASILKINAGLAQVGRA